MVAADGGHQNRSWRSVAGRLLEAESAWWGVWFDLISHLVDDDMVMKASPSARFDFCFAEDRPVEGDEVVGVGSAALGPGDLGVGLKPIP